VKSEIFMVPCGIERELVVRNHKRTRLLLGEMLDPNDGHAFKAEQLCSLEPSMSGDDLAPAIGKNWYVEAKFAHRSCDLVNLLFRMSFRIARRWFERFNWALFDPQRAARTFRLAKVIGQGTVPLEPPRLE
jgi:hypothetical protein